MLSRICRRVFKTGTSRFANRPIRSSRLGIENLENRHLLAGDLVISEVVASNDKGFEDEDEDRPDWFELFNASDDPVDLTGWYATDKEDDLIKWEFPETLIEPGDFLIVFASGKNRAVAGEPLHTNFKLAGDGEYLAITHADGTTIEADLTFGEQYSDISYGLEQKNFVYSYVVAGASSQVTVPTSGADDGVWTSVDFDDAAWSSQELGVGFDGGGELSSLISATGDLSAMQGSNASAYVRTSFTIDDEIPDLDQLNLNVNYDDGFVAYLNGTEVARSNAPENLAWNSTATEEHGGVLASISYEGFSDPSVQEEFQTNGSASWVDGNATITKSSPFQLGSTFRKEPIPFGQEYSFSSSMKLDVAGTGGITSDADGKGGQGMTFVLQSGGPFNLGAKEGGLGLENLGAAFVAIELDTFATGAFDPDADLPTHIGIDTSEAGSVARVAVPRFNDGDRGESPVYLWVDYNGDTEQMDVYFSDAATKPGTPTLSTEVDLGAIFQGAPSLWGGWTAATNLAWNSHEVMDWQIETRSSELGLAAEVFDITQHKDLLTAGENVLAIHGLNVNPTDDDFLVSATLSGAEENVLFVDEYKFFVEPTPGKTNGAGTNAPAENVEFSVTGRTFAEPFSLELTGPADATEIRYTLDGSIPSELSTLYTGPIEISETSRVRAVAIVDGFAPSIPRTENFVLLGSQLTSFEGGVFESNIPIVVIDSFGDSAVNSDAAKMGATATFFFDVDETTGMASLLDEPDVSVTAGVRIRGQSSQGWPKKQYAVEGWDENIDYGGGRLVAGDAGDQSFSPLGLPRESDWVLNGPYSDKTQLNNHTAFGLYNDVGLYSPRTKLVEVFVNSGGGAVDFDTDYRGTYVLMEKIKIDKDRVDLAEAIFDPEPEQDPRTVGGYIFKQDKDGAGDVNFRANSGGPSINFKFVEPDAPTDAQETWLTDFVNKAESVLYSDDWLDPDEGYRKYFDTDTFIDHWLITELAKEIDGFRLSEYFVLNRDGKIAEGPAWDFNLSFSNGNYLQGGKWEGWYHTGISGAQYHWYPRLFDDPEFASEVADRWFELRKTIFSKESLFEKIDASVDMLTNGSPNFNNPTADEGSNPISRNFDRWGTVSSYLWPNCFFNGNSPANECRPSPLPAEMSPNGQPNSYDDYIFIMKDFLENRLTWIDSQFGAPVEFDPPGGMVAPGTEVTLTTDGPGTLYYTTDGSDPQQPQIVLDEEVVLPFGSALKYIVPTDADLITACKSTGISLRDPERCFINPIYEYGTHGETWSDGNAGIGFGYDGLSTDIQSEAQNVNSSVYVKIPFEVTAEQRESWDGVGLNVKYDDGYVAYLWFNTLKLPAEIARTNAPGTSPAFPIRTLSYDAASETDRPDVDGESAEFYDFSNRRQYVNVGENFLVVQLLNNDVSDPSLAFDVEVVGLTERVVLPDNVIPYTGPFTITENTEINARTYDSETDEWGSRRRESYFTSVPPIVISEVMFHPAAPTATEVAAGYEDADEFEFLEFINTGNTAYDLGGARVSEGISFGFDAGTSLAGGERGVVVRNQAAFEQRYGTDINILGTWADSVDPVFSAQLSNSGERLVLKGAVGEPLLDFTYSDDWHPLTDGDGYSLTIVDPQADRATWNDSSSWRVSDTLGGTPGSTDAGIAPPTGSIVINELLANGSVGDAVELRNTTNSAIDLSSFYVTDDPTDLTKFQVAAGTTLPANGFVVLDGDNVTGGFALADTGGRLVVQAASNSGDLIGFQTDRRFDAAELDVAEGIYTTSTGNVDFVPLTTPTLGSENAGPTIGPLVVSEIMYNPLPGGVEWIELQNISTDTLNLGQDDWSIDEAFTYTFPDGASVGASEYVLLIQGADGSDHATVVSDFRSANDVPDGVDIYVYEPTANGSLNNNGEDVSVGRAVAEGDMTVVIKTELIEYDNAAPWPLDADGTGKSISRLASTTYGNEPSNWITGPTGGTPGAANPGGSPLDLNGDGSLGVADLDVLYKAIRDGVDAGENPNVDVDGNGTIDVLDVDRWLTDAGNAIVGRPYLRGDANLDSVIDVQDLNRVGIHWLESATSWGEGDFTVDGLVNASDLNHVGVNWQHGVGQAARVPRAPLALVMDARVDHALATADLPSSRSLPPIESDAPELGEAGSSPLRRRARDVQRRQIRYSGQAELLSNVALESYGNTADDVFAGW